MIRPVGTLENLWMHANYMRLARSGPHDEALSRQLGALNRRRRLRSQQENLQNGAAGAEVLPTYRRWPRPPS